MKEAAEFYTNRVLKEGDDNQKAWAKAFPVVLGDLGNFVKKYHTTGLVWNPKVTCSSLFSSKRFFPFPLLIFFSFLIFKKIGRRGFRFRLLLGPSCFQARCCCRRPSCCCPRCRCYPRRCSQA